VSRIAEHGLRAKASPSERKQRGSSSGSVVGILVFLFIGNVAEKKRGFHPVGGCLL
jgi:hypothetical protein